MFLDLAVDRNLLGRVVIELFDQSFPKTCRNFVELCVGGLRRQVNGALIVRESDYCTPSGTSIGYKHCKVHAIRPGQYILAGDVVHQDGRGSISIYGDSFMREMIGTNQIEMLPNQAGLLCIVADAATGQFGCQFLITCAELKPELQLNLIVIGRVVQGMHFVTAVEHAPIHPITHQPKQDISIIECGEM